MKPLSKRDKVDVGLVPQTLNNTNATGKYYRMNMDRKAMAVITVGAMAAGKTAVIELLQATNVAGSNAKGLPSTAGQAAKATIEANKGVIIATLTIATAVASNAITINGQTYTAIANGATASGRQWPIGAGGTADADSAASLAAIINDVLFGVAGVTASAAGGVITLTATEPGTATITIADAAATITPATVQALAYVEVDAAQLDTKNGFEYIAAKVTTTANTVASVVLIRGDSRFEPTQQVAAGVVL